MPIVEINFRPAAKDLRWFGLLLWIFLALVGALLSWRAGSLAPARILIAVGGGLCLVYYALPPLRRPLFVGWMVAFYPLGWLLSHLLFASIYFLVITPTGALMRLFGYDPMTRRKDLESRPTYWTERPPGGDAARYFRQF